MLGDKLFQDKTYEVYKNPNSTGHQLAGAIIKVGVGFVLTGVSMNPVIGIGLGILDITGVSDAIFAEAGTLYRQ